MTVPTDDEKATLAERQRNLKAKQAILSAIRESLSAGVQDWVAPPSHHETPEVQPREPLAPPLPPPAAFARSLEAVAGRCTIVRSEAEAAARVESLLVERGARTVAVSDAPLVQALIGRMKPGPVLVQNADVAALFGCDAGITSAQWGIAETGTLVLDSRAERHRFASLLPPLHVAVIRADRIRRTLAEVLEAIDEGDPAGPGPLVTLITGPSRTSDIELTLAIGVHGPCELEVIVVDEEAG